MPQPMSLAAKGAVSTALWMVTSLAVLILNKQIYSSGFRYPLFVTGLGQLISMLGGMLMVRLSILSMPHVSSPLVMLHNVAPVVLAFASSLFFGNYAFVYLSIAFVQMLKAFTPAITLLICLLVRLERFSAVVALSVLLIGLGTGSTIFIEQSAPSFHLLGFLAFLLSSISEASKTVSSQLLLTSKSGFSTAHAMIYIGGLTSVLLLLGSALFERHAILSHGYLLALQHPLLFTSSFVASFLVNLFNYWAVTFTSSVSVKVAGCVKNIAAAMWGVVMHAEVVTPLQVVGYMVSMGGVGLYSWHKSAVYKPGPTSPLKNA